MLAVTSGRSLLQPYNYNLMNKNEKTQELLLSKYKQLINKKTLISMLKMEQELRTSDKYIQLLEKEAIETYDHPDKSSEYYNNKVWLSDVLENIQHYVVNKFGFINQYESIGLEILRSAQIMYPNDEEIKNSVHYIKYNKAAECKFQIGDICSNINKMIRLFSLDGNRIDLNSIIDVTRYNLIIGASMS